MQNKANNKYFVTIKKKTFKKTPSFSLAIFLLKYTNFGVYLMAPILMGLTIGVFLDTLLKVKPLLTVFFLFIGTVSTFYNIYKLVRDGKNASYKH